MNACFFKITLKTTLLLMPGFHECETFALGGQCQETQLLEFIVDTVQYVW